MEIVKHHILLIGNSEFCILINYTTKSHFTSV